MFLNRKRELALLEESYASDHAELFVLYGRRRVGKSELLRVFCEGKRHIFFVADLGTETGALADFTRQVSRHAHGSTDALGPFLSWSAALEFLAGLADQKRLVVVLDEFTYLAQVNPAVPSILQRVWDERLRGSRIMLILCGSYVGMMERQVLAYRAPLYGRRTAQWRLEPLQFADARLFMPRYSPTDQVRGYAALGGVPAYLTQIDDRRSLLANVADRILAPGAFLHDEPRFLLLQELGDPGRYMAILEAIANKRTRLNEIAQAVGLPAASLPFYLGTLRELRLLERETPVTERHPERSKRGSYRIVDDYFRFWFRFVHPSRSLLARGRADAVIAEVRDQMDEFTAPAFEAICRDHLWRLADDGVLGFIPTSIGRWWDGDDEIDAVAVGEHDLLLAECKWSNRPVGLGLLEDLRRKAARVPRTPVQRLRFALFSRAGFTSDARQQAAVDNVRLVDLAEIAA